MEGKKLNKNDNLKTNYRQSNNFVPFHVQPRYVNKVYYYEINTNDTNSNAASDTPYYINNNNWTTKIVSEKSAKACKGADHNEMKI